MNGHAPKPQTSKSHARKHHTCEDAGTADVTDCLLEKAPQA